MIDRLLYIRRGGVGFVPRFLVLAEAESAVYRAAHVEQKNNPVLVHLLEQPLVKLADPGVGVAGVVQFLDERQVLVGHVAGDPHLSDGVHGEPHRIGVQHLLHVRSIRFRNSFIGFFFKLLRRFDGNKFIAGQDDFQDGHEQKVGQFDTVDNDRMGAVGFAQQGEQRDEEPFRIPAVSAGIEKPGQPGPAVAVADDVDKRLTDKCLDTKMIEETR
jgi:hypothetical protein